MDLRATSPHAGAILHLSLEAHPALRPSLQEAVQDAVFNAQADLLLLFSSSRVCVGPLAPLAYQPQEAAVRRMWSHCEALLDREPAVRPCDTSGY